METSNLADDKLYHLLRKKYTTYSKKRRNPSVAEETGMYKIIRLMGQQIRSDTNWNVGLKYPETRERQIAEATKMFREFGEYDDLKVLELPAINALFERLDYLATLQPKEGAKLSNIDYVWFSDTLIDSATLVSLKQLGTMLENDSEHHNDIVSYKGGQLVKLIDPLLFPFAAKHSRVLVKPIISPKDALSFGSWKQGRFYDYPSHIFLPENYDCVSNFKKSEHNRFQKIEKYFRLPAEFSVDLEGSVTIESYINNLHPIDYSDFYPTIASAFSCMLPLFEQTLTDIAHFQYSREIPVKEDLPLRPITPYSLRGRRLQVVVEMANIVLMPNSPEYTGTTWCAGKIKLCTDEIIATGVYCYDSDNVTDGGVELREYLYGYGCESRDPYYDSGGGSEEDSDYDLMRYTYKFVSQSVGIVDFKPGRCMVYSNVYQSRDTKFKLCDPSKPGYRKLLKFYLVDPTHCVPSSATVSPLQKNWWARQVRQIARFAVLPNLVWDKIVNYVDYPMSLKEARRIRKEIMDDDGDNAIYSPDYRNWHGYEVCLTIPR